MSCQLSRRAFLSGAIAFGSLAIAGGLAAPVRAHATDAAGVPGAGTPFPSWRPDSASLERLVAFVKAATDEQGADFTPPEARVATFDMDGTLLCERDPIYFDWSLLRHRVLEDEAFSAPDDMRSLLEEISSYMNEGVVPTEFNAAKEEAVGRAFAGMTPKEFMAYVTEFMDTHEAQGFSGMTYGESLYRPMLEVVDYLRAHDFDVYVVTACSRFVARAFACGKLGMRPDHVVGTDDVLVAEGQGTSAGQDYTLAPGEGVVLSGEREAENGKANKVFAIANQIGVQPVLAFGNSGGDYAMAQYACDNPDYPGAAFLVLCDDTAREYGDEDKAAQVAQACDERGWTAISMRDDWATIYGEGVERA